VRVSNTSIISAAVRAHFADRRSADRPQPTERRRTNDEGGPSIEGKSRPHQKRVVEGFAFDRLRTMDDPVSYKNLLQEYLQKRGLRLPRYVDIQITKEDGTIGFASRVSCDASVEACDGNGRSKREAEQAAAKRTYGALLEKEWNERCCTNRSSLSAEILQSDGRTGRSNLGVAPRLPPPRDDEGDGDGRLSTAQDGSLRTGNGQQEELETQLREV
jgi:hypothetical protein